MREIRTLRSMSGKRKRSAGLDKKPKPPRLFSTLPSRPERTMTDLILTMGQPSLRIYRFLFGMPDWLTSLRHRLRLRWW